LLLAYTFLVSVRGCVVGGNIVFSQTQVGRAYIMWVVQDLR